MHGIETASAHVASESRIADRGGLIRAEYQEMPELCRRRAQMQCLWRLEPAACDRVLGALADAGYLRQTSGGSMRG